MWRHYRVIPFDLDVALPPGLRRFGLALFGGGGAGSICAGGGGGGFAYGEFMPEPSWVVHVAFVAPGQPGDGAGLSSPLHGLSVTGGRAAQGREGGVGGQGTYQSETQPLHPPLHHRVYTGGAGGSSGDPAQLSHLCESIPGGGGGAGSFYGDGGAGGGMAPEVRPPRMSGWAGIGACGGGGFGGAGGRWFEGDLCYGGGGLQDTAMKAQAITASGEVGRYCGPGGGGSGGAGDPAGLTHGGRGGAADWQAAAASPYLRMAGAGLRGRGGDGFGPHLAKPGGPGGGGGGGGVDTTSPTTRVVAPGGPGGFGGGGGGSPLWVELKRDVPQSVGVPLLSGGPGGFGGGGGGGPIGGRGGPGGGGGGALPLQGHETGGAGGAPVAIVYW